MKPVIYDAVAALGRILLAAIFVYAGIEKIHGYAGTAHLMSAHGIPGALLPAVIALELGGGLALALGVLTRAVAAALAAFSVAAICIFLLPPANSLLAVLVFAEFAMVGGLCGYAANGAGRFAVDRLLFR